MNVKGLHTCSPLSDLITAGRDKDEEKNDSFFTSDDMLFYRV